MMPGRPDEGKTGLIFQSMEGSMDCPAGSKTGHLIRVAGDVGITVKVEASPFWARGCSLLDLLDVTRIMNRAEITVSNTLRYFPGNFTGNSFQCLPEADMGFGMTLAIVEGEDISGDDAGCGHI
jgi:hypothetical protein